MYMFMCDIYIIVQYTYQHHQNYMETENTLYAIVEFNDGNSNNYDLWLAAVYQMKSIMQIPYQFKLVS